MATKVFHPKVSKELIALGERIRLARLRRDQSMAIVSERAGISRPTLSAIENGDSGVSLGAYLSVLNALGLAKDISKIAADDELGRKLQDLNLDKPRERSSKRRAS